MTDERTAEQIWVTTKEGAEITGYHQDYLRKLASKMLSQPESERVIQIRSRSHRFELWLPDLYKYIADQGYGPHVNDRE